MKRCRSGSEESDVTFEDAALQGAEVLLGLRFGTWGEQDAALEERQQSGAAAATSQQGARSSVSGDQHRPTKAQRTGCTGHAPTRSYVWRGPHRGGNGAKRKSDTQQCQQAQQQEQQQQQTAEPHSPSSRGSSEDDESSNYCSADAGSHKQRDKEWAALTTWLRMNLHHPRTMKKLVLFVGSQAASGKWVFDLNPGLSWDDVSIETKLRLKMLPQETETAFAHKYPERPSSEWATKQQKYKAPGSSQTFTISLANMVNSLRDIYFKYEPNSPSSSSSLPAGSFLPSGSSFPSGSCGAAAAGDGGSFKGSALPPLVRLSGAEGSGSSVDDDLQLQLPYLLLV